jgi:hypothetical protein
MKIYITLALLLINLFLNAEVRYVSKTGSNTAPYTSWETACDSLQKCFDYCNNGDTVYVDRGVYRESIYINAKNLSIIGVDTDECIIDGTGVPTKEYDSCISIKLSNCTVSTLTIKKTESFIHTFYYALYIDGGSILVEHCNIDSTITAMLTAANSLIRNNLFRNNGIALSCYTFSYEPTFEIYNNYIQVVPSYPIIGGIDANWGGKFIIKNNYINVVSTNMNRTGIWVESNERVEISNNFVNNFDNNIVIRTWVTPPYDSSYVTNNTLLNSKYSSIVTGSYGQFYCIKNNILAHNAKGINLTYAQNFISDYNLFFNTSGDNYINYSQGLHDVFADPMFAKDTLYTLGAIDNFRLQKFSPAIDAGDPSILDVDGSRSDIGMFGGPGGISYEYQDLAPKVVKKLKAVYEPDTNRVKLTWKPNTEADLKEYYVYKDINPSFTLDSTKRIAILSDTLFYDRLEKGTQKVYYKVTAIDNSGNQSYPSAEVNVTITNVNEVTITDNYEYALYQNYPNPFNPTTTISYSLKDESEVRIKIYAITGELIKTIIEGNKSKGYNETQIDLSNMASGIYLYRLEVTGKGKIPVFNDLKKMVLLK